MSKASHGVQTYSLDYFRQRQMGKTLDDPFNEDLHTPRSYRRVIERLGGPTQDDEVLDVCCGLGSGTHALAGRVRRAVGVDISVDAIAFANEHYARPGEVEFQCADVLNHELKGTFDAAVMVDVIEHFSQEGARQLLQALRGNLKPGGRIYIHLPLGRTPGARLLRVKRGVKEGIDYTGDPSHLETYTLKDALSFLETTGLRVERFRCTYYVPGFPTARVERVLDKGGRVGSVAISNVFAVGTEVCCALA